MLTEKDVLNKQSSMLCIKPLIWAFSPMVGVG
jgi:hypothetical protein